jgi:hypothetical protein
MGQNIENPAALLVDPFGNPLYPTAFGELRAVAPYTVADLINRYGIDPRDYGTALANGGTATHVPAQGAIQLVATTNSASSCKLRTHTYYRYQAGKATRWRTTLYHADAGQANQTRRWGQFEDSDGLFFQLVGTALSIVRRTSTSGATVDNVVAQAAWNVDKLDGTGSSGVTLDVTKGNIYECTYQWLGVGVVHWFVSGVLVHTMEHANTLAVPYMKTATLPLSWEVVNAGATASSTGLTYICASVYSEGGQEPPGGTFATFNAADKSVTTTEIPVLAIRVKALFNSLTNRMSIRPFRCGVSTEGVRLGYRLVVNPTLTGASWTSVDNESGVEQDVAATAFSGGTTLFRGFLPNSNDKETLDLVDFFSANSPRIHLRLDAFAASQDVLALLAITETTGTSLVRASLAWKEYR